VEKAKVSSVGRDDKASPLR